MLCIVYHPLQREYRQFLMGKAGRPNDVSLSTFEGNFKNHNLISTAGLKVQHTIQPLRLKSGTGLFIVWYCISYTRLVDDKLTIGGCLITGNDRVGSEYNPSSGTPSTGDHSRNTFPFSSPVRVTGNQVFPHTSEKRLVKLNLNQASRASVDIITSTLVSSSS